jgi:hypothetical protein
LHPQKKQELDDELGQEDIRTEDHLDEVAPSPHFSLYVTTPLWIMSGISTASHGPNCKIQAGNKRLNKEYIGFKNKGDENIASAFGEDISVNRCLLTVSFQKEPWLVTFRKTTIDIGDPFEETD